MKQTRLHLFILFLLFCAGVSASGFSIERLSIADQLPNNIVKRIFQSKSGYIWFGTESGICRFDGYKIKVVKSGEYEWDRSVSNNILCISQDEKGHIWVGTRKGVKVMDEDGRLMPEITHIQIQEKRVTALCSRGNQMWIGTNDGLFVYDTDNHRVKRYSHSDANRNSLPGNNINHIFRDSKDNIWIAFWQKGICRFNPNKDNFEPMPAFGKYNNPFFIYEDKSGLIWLGTWGDGLVQMAYSSQSRQTNYRQYNLAENKEYSEKKNIIYSLTQDSRTGNLMLVTPLGLFRFRNKEPFDFENIRTGDVYSNTSNFLHTIYKDNKGNIWIGASNDGIYLLSEKRDFFQYELLNQAKKEIGYTIVNALEEINGWMWAGLTNGGVVAFNPNNKAQTEYANTLSGTSIRAIINVPEEQTIWVAGERSFRLKKSGNKYTVSEIQYRLKEANNRFNPVTLDIYHLCRDEQKRIWIAAQSGIYYCQSPDSLIRVAPDFGEVSMLLCENKNTIWASSYNSGIVRLCADSRGKWQISQFSLANKKVNSTIINTLFKDSRGRIWAGSSDAGVSIYNPKTDSFEPKNGDLSLLETFISSIVEDKRGDIWLSTGNKVVCIDRKNNGSVIYSRNDNVRVSTFRPHAATVTSDNQIFMGGSEGICYFHPVKQPVPTESNKVLLTDIEVNNRSVFDDKINNEIDFDGERLVLTHNQQNVGIEFSSLNYASPDNVKYAYLLVGQDKDWVYVDDKRRFVTYNNLGAGNYTFRVRSTNENGIWSEKITEIKIEVLPAPYLSWWAFCIYILLAGGLILFSVKTIRNRIRLRNQLAISEIEKMKAEELTQTKLRYFTNVSHELMTPLTIISCIVDEISDKHPEVVIDRNRLKANVNRLKRLLQQILDFRKTESTNMKLRVHQADVVEFIRSICRMNFEPLAREKNINFRLHTTIESQMAWFDSDKIDKVLFNLLSNAFKFTPAGGSVEVRLQLEFIGGIDNLKIEVADSGKGIEPALLPHIFTRFVTGNHDNKVETNGIGLSLSKDLIEIHKGSVSVVSEPHRGSTFTFHFPIGEAAYHQDEKGEAAGIPGSEDEGETEEKPATVASADTAAETLLLVEDNPDLLHVLQNHFSKKYKVLTAVNGRVALDVLSENDIQIIVSDIMMPEMDGLELCKTIKGKVETSHIPVLLVTAKNQVEDRIECYNAGADGYIAKPFDMSLLDVRVRNLLTRRAFQTNEYKQNPQITLSDLEYNSLDQQFLDAAVRFVEENLGNFELSHDDLLVRLNTTKSTLYRKLKSLTGLSPSEFIKNIRIKHACRMLQKESGNISDIAYSVGFNDPKYFSTCFKAEMGMTPREYAKNIRGNEPE